MGITAIFKALTGGLTKDVGAILDDVITSKEERMDAERKITESIMNNSQAMEQQLTDRHANDMKSDNPLAKSVRPFTLLFILGFTTMLAFTDGNIADVQIKDHYISVIESWGSLVFMFYFGSRGAEKIFKTINQK
jgi:hypothetical protein